MIVLHEITGVVMAGQKRGKTLGFPTANLLLTEDIPEGIYAATVTIKNKLYQAATFIGNAKTFNESDKKAESYIFDFDQTIYGEEITVKLYQKIRNNQNFSSVEELVSQMIEDVKNITKFFKENLTD